MAGVIASRSVRRCWYQLSLPASALEDVQQRVPFLVWGSHPDVGHLVELYDCDVPLLLASVETAQGQAERVEASPPGE